MIFCGNSTAAACPDKFSLPDIILPADELHKGQKSEELTEIYRSVPRFPGLSFRLRVSISFAVSGRSHPARPTVVVRRSPWLRFRHSEGVH